MARRRKGAHRVLSTCSTLHPRGCLSVSSLEPWLLNNNFSDYPSTFVGLLMWTGAIPCSWVSSGEYCSDLRYTWMFEFLFISTFELNSAFSFIHIIPWRNKSFPSPPLFSSSLRDHFHRCPPEMSPGTRPPAPCF